MRRIASVIVLLILFSTVFLAPAQTVQGSSLQEDTNSLEPNLLVKKNELIEAKYSPMGDLTSKMVSTWVEIYNNGSQSSTVDIIDRIDSINTSTLSMLYGTPRPTKLETFGSLTLVTWEGITIEPNGKIKYEYLADSFKEIPVKVDEKILINGELAEIGRLGELYTINANVSDVITLQFTLKNESQKLYTNKGEVLPPVPCIVSATLSEDNFSNLKAEPETNSTSTIAGKSVMTWYVFLEESSVNFTISAKISKVGPWGEVVIDPISIQILTDTSLLEEQLERAIDNLNPSIEMMEEFMETMQGFSGAFSGLSSALKQIAKAIEGVILGLNQLRETVPQISEALKPIIKALNQIKEGLYKLADGLASASSSTKKGGKEIEEPIMDLKDEKEDLDDLILALNYGRNKPFDLEVKNSEGSQNSEIYFDVWEGYVENTWMIMKADTTNSESYAKMVHGLSIQIKADGELIQPTRVDVVVSPLIKGIQYVAEWRAFNMTELEKIGLEYDQKSSTLYLWSMKRVNASSSENLLVDWLNRPIRIILESHTEPEILYNVDIVNLSDRVHIESTESQSVYSITQPHFLIQNVTWVEPPPSPPPPKDWLQTIIENLQKPEIQLLAIIFVVAIVSVSGILLMKRRGAFEKRKLMPEEERTIKDLIKEIEDMKKILKGEEEQNN